MYISHECHERMLGLKGIVEGLLALPSNNVWNTYGGLDRLAAAVERILTHRMKSYQVGK